MRKQTILSHSRPAMPAREQHAMLSDGLNRESHKAWLKFVDAAPYPHEVDLSGRAPRLFAEVLRSDFRCGALNSGTPAIRIGRPRTGASANRRRVETKLIAEPDRAQKVQSEFPAQNSPRTARPRAAFSR